MTIEIGPVSELVVSWRNSSSSVEREVWDFDDALSRIRVHPHRMEVQSRLQLKVSTEADPWQSRRSLTLPLPPDATVTRISAPQLVTATAPAAHRHDDALTLVLEASPGESVLLEFDFVAPVSAVDGEVRIPAWSPLPKGTVAAMSKHAMGFTASSGFRLAPFADNVTDERVNTMSINEFARRWRPDETSIPPSFAYELSAPTVLRFRESPLKASRVATIDQRLSFERRRVGWNAEVLLNVEQIATAVHELQVDPRLEIETVAVQQDGAERIVHWSRNSEGQLTLFLSDELTGAQTITLRGALMQPAEEKVAIPSCELVDGRVLASRLRVSHAAAGTLEIWRRNAEARVERLRADVAGEFGPFDLETVDAPMAVRFRRGRDDVVVRELLVLRPYEGTDGAAVEVQADVRLISAAGPLVDVDVSLPASWREATELTVSPEPTSLAEQGHGERLLTWEPMSPDTQEVALRFTARFPVHKESEPWPLPGVVVLSAQWDERYLIIDDRLALRPLNAHEWTADAGSLLPDEVTGILEEEGAGPWRVFRGADSPWILGQSATEFSDADVPLAQTVVWSQADGQIAGLTNFWINVRRHGPLGIRLATGTVLTWADLNGTLVETDGDRELVTIPTENAAGLQRLWLSWTREDRQRGLGRSLDIPQLVDLPVAVHQVAIASPCEQCLWGVEGVETVTPAEWEVTFVERLLDMAGLASSLPQSPDGDAWRRLAAAARDALQGDDIYERLSEEQQEKLVRLSESRATSASAAPPVTGAAEPVDVLSWSRSSADHSLYGELKDEDGHVEYRVMTRWHRSLLVLPLVLGVLLILLGSQSVRQRGRRWMTWCLEHPAVGLCSLVAFLLIAGELIIATLVVTGPLLVRARGRWLA